MKSISIQQNERTGFRRLSAIVAASAGMAVAVLGITLATATLAEAGTIHKPSVAKQPRKIVKLPTRPSTRPHGVRADRVPARPGRGHADRVPARPGRGHANRTPARPGKARPRIRDFRDKRR